MEITEVRVTLREEPRLKAFVNVTFDDDFVVRGMKVIAGKNGLFVAMPSRRSKDGSFRDIAHPINNEMRKRLEDTVLEEYNKKCLEEGKEPKSAELEQEDFEVPEEDIETIEGERELLKDDVEVSKEDIEVPEEVVEVPEEDIEVPEEDIEVPQADIETDVVEEEEEEGSLL